MDGLERRKPPVDQRNFRPIEQLVHEEMIADQDSTFHRRRGHHRSFPDENPHSQNDGAQYDQTSGGYPERPWNASGAPQVGIGAGSFSARYRRSSHDT